VNRFERVLDRSPAALNVRLRLLKKKLRGDPLLEAADLLVSPGDVAIDIGANRGVYTHHLARRVGRAGRVHSIDPFPDNAEVLRSANARRPQVVVHHAALSDRTGRASLFVPRVSGRPIHALASLEAPQDGGDIEHLVLDVDVRRLDSLLGEDGSRVGFIKCDVEGHELSVLRGAAELLQDKKPHLIIEIEQRHGKQDIQLVFDTLTSWGYGGFAFFPGGLQPLQEFDVDRDQLAYLTTDFVPYGMPGGYVSDFLFTRPGTDVSALLR
jgi:FkbM family methyltransferase